MRGQRGAALISALMTVALVAIVSSSLIAEVGRASDMVMGRGELAQARWLSLGAVDWARNILAEDARTSAVDHLGEPWALAVPPLPIENGEIGGYLEDLDRRFNLNALLRDGEGGEKATIAYRRLLQNLGFAPEEVRQLADALADWLDADDVDRRSGGSEMASYATAPVATRPANGPLLSVGELQRVAGYSSTTVARLAPFVAALPPIATINVNTASPEVLSAVLPAVDLDGARQLAARRETAWFRIPGDLDGVLSSPVVSAALLPLATQSRYFLAHGRVRFGDAVVNSETQLDRASSWPTIQSTVWL